MTHQHLAQAAKLAPIVERVHGEHHPEMTRVREITETLVRTDDRNITATLFTELRDVTNNYAIPNGVCEAFEATYKSLEKADIQQAA